MTVLHDEHDDPSQVAVLTPEEVAFAAELARLHPSDDDRVIYADEFGEHGLEVALMREHSDAGLPGDHVLPEPGSDVLAAEVQAAAARSEGCDAGDLALLERVDPASLEDPLARIAYIQVLNRVEAAVAARRYDAVLSIVPVLPHASDYVAEGAWEIELAVACRSSFRASRQLIDAARAGRMVFPGMHTALAAGLVSDRHLRVLLERTRVIDDAATLALIGEQALPLALALTPPRFEDALERVIVRHDPDAPARRKKAHARRDVWTCRLPDGMAFLGITTDAATVEAMKRRIISAAKDLQRARGGVAAARAGDPDAALAACRADAATALILGTRDDDGSITLDPDSNAVHVQLVIDLETLRGEANNPALLDGSPVPAQMGRDLAGYARAFRRMVTDPVTGHLLDFGRENYLPRPLRDYVLHRDGRCRIPGCPCAGIDAMQMDHATRFPDGPSTAANTGAISPRCHQIKTAGHIDLVDGRPDGSVTLVTLLRQRIHIPARPFMGWDPGDGPPPSAGPPDPGHLVDEAPPF